MPSGGRWPTRGSVETRLDERQEEPRLLRREDLSRGGYVISKRLGDTCAAYASPSF